LLDYISRNLYTYITVYTKVVNILLYKIVLTGKIYWDLLMCMVCRDKQK